MHGDVNSWLTYIIFGAKKIGVLPFNEHRFIPHVVLFCKIRLLAVHESCFEHGILNFIEINKVSPNSRLVHVRVG